MTQLKIGLGNGRHWEDAKSTKYRSPWPKCKTLTGAPLWRTGNKGAPPLPQTLAVRNQPQRKTEAPSSAPPKTQLNTGDVINVSKQDEQGSKFALTACRIEDMEETPPARILDLQYPLWVINADLFVEYSFAGFVPKWLFDVMMLGKDVIFYGEADVVHRIGRRHAEAVAYGEGQGSDHSAFLPCLVAGILLVIGSCDQQHVSV